MYFFSNLSQASYEILVSTSNFQIKEHFLFAFAISTFIAGSVSIATKSPTECILIFLHRRVNLNV